MFDYIFETNPKRLGSDDQKCREEISTLLATKELSEQASENRRLQQKDPSTSDFLPAHVIIIQDLLSPILMVRRMYDLDIYKAKLENKGRASLPRMLNRNEWSAKGDDTDEDEM